MDRLLIYLLIGFYVLVPFLFVLVTLYEQQTKLAICLVNCMLGARQHND